MPEISAKVDFFVCCSSIGLLLRLMSVDLSHGAELVFQCIFEGSGFQLCDALVVMFDAEGWSQVETACCGHVWVAQFQSSHGVSCTQVVHVFCVVFQELLASDAI